MTRRPYKDIMARVLAKHAGVSLDDIEYLDHARGVRTRDGSYTVALYGAPVRGLVVKHRQIRVTRGLKSLAVQDVEDLLAEADLRFEAYCERLPRTGPLDRGFEGERDRPVQ